jgi:hypothetical protein
MNWSTASIKGWAVAISYFTFCLLSFSLFAQKQVNVHADGTSVSSDMTPKQAFEEALAQAKKNALLKAGVPENLLVSNLMFEYGNEQNVESYFHGISNTELNANILVDSIYEDKRWFDSYGYMNVQVEIDATVFTYGKPKDPAFFFDIEGLKEVYLDQEHIRFAFIPSADGYLTIFAFNEDESYVLYPFENQEYDYLSDESERLFVKEESVSFPIHPAYRNGYSIEMNDPVEDEASILLFVFTKKHIPWIDEQVSLESVRSWIYKIPMDQREILYRNVLLKHPN